MPVTRSPTTPSDRCGLAPEGRRPSWRGPSRSSATAGSGQRAAPEQIRSWNLSAIWRLPTSEGRVWLKAVPSFFAHEGAVIDWIGPETAPRLVAHTRGRVLMAEIPGPSNHDTRGPALLLPMVDLLTRLQERSVGRTDELVGLRRSGPPAGRHAPPDHGRRRRARVHPERSRAQRRGAPRPRPARAAWATSTRAGSRTRWCTATSTPETSEGRSTSTSSSTGVTPSWATRSSTSSPSSTASGARTASPLARRSWRAWRRIAPSADPERAAALLRPVLPLLAAVMYADFCAAIEPAERVYHSSDVTAMLRHAAEKAPAERSQRDAQVRRSSQGPAPAMSPHSTTGGPRGSWPGDGDASARLVGPAADLEGHR